LGPVKDGPDRVDRESERGRKHRRPPNATSTQKNQITGINCGPVILGKHTVGWRGVYNFWGLKKKKGLPDAGTAPPERENSWKKTSIVLENGTPNQTTAPVGT